MTLNEDRNELNQQKWFSRFARERLDLSVSVEQTLVEPTVEKLLAPFGTNPLPASLHTAARRTLFPPLLSLQSRLLPTVYSTNMTSSAIVPSPQFETGPFLSNVDRESVLQRFAQRLTSSCVASPVVDALVLPQTLSEEPVQLAFPSPFQRTENHLPVPYPIEATSRNSTDAFPSLSSSPEMSQTAQHRLRLAGRTTKIRLETAPLAAAHAHHELPPSVDKHATVPILSVAIVREATSETSAHLPTITATRPGSSATSSHLPVVGFPTHPEESTSTHLPAVDALKESTSAAARSVFSGTGIFEPGQSDLIVSNPHITASSVVLVMLTANPGPVVVQYVSLQPHTGFTLHLTAPAVMRTPFNYVVLASDYGN